MTGTGQAPASPPAGAGRLAGAKLQVRSRVRAAFGPLVSLLARLGVRPDHLSVAGLAFGALAGALFLLGRWRAAALALIVAGLCDMLDGQLARRLGLETRFGAFLDSTFDRLSEGFVIAGITGFYVRFADLQPLELDPILFAVVVMMIGMLALVGSFLVSYTRARAEGLGIACNVGWFERPERIAVLVLAGLLKNLGVMFWALIVLGLVSFWTAFQRARHVWRQTREADLDPREGTPS
ncbi:MAG TPA: CDP-alcohol phosphatidyltransferase family protein [Terriglobales bacterium]|nr:CDP-alcohol phosphatidyltransferase family protein [Terriglobales bacterium]